MPKTLVIQLSNKDQTMVMIGEVSDEGADGLPVEQCDFEQEVDDMLAQMQKAVDRFTTVNQDDDND